MTEKMTYLKNPVQIKRSNGHVVTILGFGPAKQPDYLQRKDLFVKQDNIYILDTFHNKTKMKIAAFNRRIKEAIDYTTKFRDGCKELIVLSNRDSKVVPPTLNIYVNCPDEKIDERAYVLLDTIANAVKRGIKINVTVVGNEKGAWARLLTKDNQYKPTIERQK